MPTVQVPEGEIFYDVCGNGPPLMLVSGLGGSSSYWHALLGEFCNHFRVIVHDHRGTGQSSRSNSRYSVDIMAQDALAVMEAVGVERAYFVGHSTGGAIGQTIAIDHPGRLEGMVLYSSWTRSDTFFRRVMEARKALLTAPDGARAYVHARSFFVYPHWWINENLPKLVKADERALETFPGVEIVKRRIDAILAFDRTAELGMIRTPTLVLCARDDFLTPLYFSEELARRIPTATLKVLDRGGHGAAHTVPAEFSKAVISFLLSVQTVSPAVASGQQ